MRTTQQKQAYIIVGMIGITVTLVTSIIVASIKIGGLIQMVEINTQVNHSQQLWIAAAPPDNYEKLINASMDVLRRDIAQQEHEFSDLRHLSAELAVDVKTLKNLVQHHMNDTPRPPARVAN